MLVQPLINSSAALAAVFWCSFDAWGALELWVWWRERGPTAGVNRDRGSRMWVVAWIGAGFWAAFALMYGVPSAAMRDHAQAWFAAGIALMWMGVGLRWWAIRTLGQFFRTSVIIQGSHRMVTTGPYRLIRNPSYTGATLTMVGVGLAMNNGCSLAVLLSAALIAYARRIRVEQRALLEHFGADYQAYIARTWALIPLVW